MSCCNATEENIGVCTCPFGAAFRVVFENKIIAYEWLNRYGHWENYHVELDTTESNEVLRKHRGAFVGYDDKNAEVKRERFLGLYDAKRKEIYEGDILRDEDGGVYSVKLNDEGYGFIVNYKNSISNLPFDLDYRFVKMMQDDTIIGNIHENKELLK